MRECKVTDCHSINLVFSGIDAFLLGVPTETVCYEHANQYALVSEVIGS
jgi:hypothetical protein